MSGAHLTTSAYFDMNQAMARISSLMEKEDSSKLVSNFVSTERAHLFSETKDFTVADKIKENTIIFAALLLMHYQTICSKPFFPRKPRLQVALLAATGVDAFYTLKGLGLNIQCVAIVLDNQHLQELRSAYAAFADELTFVACDVSNPTAVQQALIATKKLPAAGFDLVIGNELHLLANEDADYFNAIITTTIPSISAEKGVFIHTCGNLDFVRKNDVGTPQVTQATKTHPAYGDGNYTVINHNVESQLKLKDGTTHVYVPACYAMAYPCHGLAFSNLTTSISVSSTQETKEDKSSALRYFGPTRKPDKPMSLAQKDMQDLILGNRLALLRGLISFYLCSNSNSNLAPLNDFQFLNGATLHEIIFPQILSAPIDSFQSLAKTTEDALAFCSTMKMPHKGKLKRISQTEAVQLLTKVLRFGLTKGRNLFSPEEQRHVTESDEKNGYLALPLNALIVGFRNLALPVDALPTLLNFCAEELTQEELTTFWYKIKNYFRQPFQQITSEHNVLKTLITIISGMYLERLNPDKKIKTGDIIAFFNEILPPGQLKKIYDDVILFCQNPEVILEDTLKKPLRDFEQLLIAEQTKALRLPSRNSAKSLWLALLVFLMLVSLEWADPRSAAAIAMSGLLGLDAIGEVRNRRQDNFSQMLQHYQQHAHSFLSLEQMVTVNIRGEYHTTYAFNFTEQTTNSSAEAKPADSPSSPPQSSKTSASTKTEADREATCAIHGIECKGHTFAKKIGDPTEAKIPATLPERKGETYLGTDERGINYFGIFNAEQAGVPLEQREKFAKAFAKGLGYSTGVKLFVTPTRGWTAEIKPEGNEQDRVLGYSSKNMDDGSITLNFITYYAGHVGKQLVDNRVPWFRGVTPAAKPAPSPPAPTSAKTATLRQ